MTHFIKMHGAGNDFVILDARTEALDLSEGWQAKVGDRQHGVGCDQIIVMESLESGKRDVASEDRSPSPSVGEALRPIARSSSEAQGRPEVFMRIYNQDGSESAACGNATRCVAWLLMEEQKADACLIHTLAGELQCWRAGNYQVKVNMGAPKLEWDQVPLSEKRNTLHLGIAGGKVLMDPVAVSVGNPHAVFFVNDVEQVNLEKWGPQLEHNPIFPEQANISAAEVVDPERIKLRVWERGVGETQACGTAACATAVAAALRGLVERHVSIELAGGMLELEWEDTQTEVIGDIFKTGPVAEVFRGVLTKEALA